MVLYLSFSQTKRYSKTGYDIFNTVSKFIVLFLTHSIYFKNVLNK